MKKKISALFIAAAMLLAAGCSGETPATTAAPANNDTAQTTAATESASNDTTTADNGGESIADKLTKSLSMSVSGLDGKMKITRSAKKTTSMGEANTWTIFVYLCGTDLESGQGSATGDIVQMLQAEGSDNVKFVIQTGGTSQWMNESFSTDKAERYVIQNKDIQLVDTTTLTNMGDSSTLANFLNWGVSNYPAERMGVVFWDHGGGSISGACFDELNDGDSLSLSEINTGLSQVYANMTDKFEFIGFDCCLMGTAEVANILATYARYFFGSQETEPGSGWDYTTYGTFLAQNPSANGAELGKVLTDSFYDECASVGQENECTFTIIDLDKFDEFTVAFNDYAQALYNAASSDLSGIVKGVNSADNFGGNNKSEGYTNMVDIGGIINNCSSYADGSAALAALKNCIVYNKNGRDHKNASGLSIYYPLQLQGSNEISKFSGICISPYYLSLVDMVAKGYSDNGYTNEVFFTEDGSWTCEDCSYEYFDENEYFEDYTEGGGESKLISFAIEPTISEDFTYGFILSEESLNYTAGVSASIYLIDEEDGTAIELGETYDVIADWEKGLFIDNFDGYWLGLADEQPLATYIVGVEDDYEIYTSPVMLNGKPTNLRIRVYGDYSAVVEGAWDGIGENGVASREIKKLSKGDKIVPIYFLDTDDDDSFDGDEYVYTGSDDVTYTMLPEGKYEYSFVIEDVYGDYFETENTMFSVDEEGNTYYEEE